MRIHERFQHRVSLLETIADVVVVVEPDASCLVDSENFRAAVTACSNVTGIHTLYHAIAKILHQAGGLCFVDFACAAPHRMLRWICIRPIPWNSWTSAQNHQTWARDYSSK